MTYYVMVHAFPCTDEICWEFDTLKEAEKCAEIMNNGDFAKDFGWKYYVWNERS